MGVSREPQRLQKTASVSFAVPQAQSTAASTHGTWRRGRRGAVSAIRSLSSRSMSVL